MRATPLIKRRKVPGIGIISFMYIHCVCFDDGDPEMDCFGQGISARSGVFTGPQSRSLVMTWRPAHPRSPGRSSGAAAPGGVSDFFSNVVSLASNALCSIPKAATAVVNLLGADGQPTGADTQTYSPSVLSRGSCGPDCGLRPSRCRRNTTSCTGRTNMRTAPTSCSASSSRSHSRRATTGLSASRSPRS
jgi:hypothetical protein